MGHGSRSSEGRGDERSSGTTVRGNLLLHRDALGRAGAVVVARQQVGVLLAEADPVVATAGGDLGLDASDTGVDDVLGITGTGRLRGSRAQGCCGGGKAGGGKDSDSGREAHGDDAFDGLGGRVLMYVGIRGQLEC